MENLEKEIANDLLQALDELFAASTWLEIGDIFVLGCSSSEIAGGRIGKASNLEAGDTVIATLVPYLKEKGLYLAVQGCEHINRALVIEREAMKAHNLTEVSVVPARHAGGATAVAAYASFAQPVLVESVQAALGMDIGDTFIGMQLKAVAVPVRPSKKTIGAAHLTMAVTRPRLFGGARACYTWTAANRV